VAFEFSLGFEGAAFKGLRLTDDLLSDILDLPISDLFASYFISLGGLFCFTVVFGGYLFN